MDAKGLRWLIDSNVLLRLADNQDANYEVARDALRTLRTRGDVRSVAAQNLIEFWVVATCPVTARGGMALSVAEAEHFLQLFRRIFVVLPETPLVLDEWYRLVTTCGVSGVQAHDARLAALMLSCGVTHILTFNTSDFARFGVTAVNPANV